jgi:K+-transporting ATPase ATPase C chain
MKKQFIIALKFFLIMTVVTGIVYPLIMTGFAQLAFPYKANGSLITKDGKIIGSELIGQKFDSTLYFWSRPSAIDYNPIPSGASNYGPTSDTLKKLVKARSNLFRKMNSLADTTEIPVEMIFASASGLDPHISPEAARLQANRIVKNRKFEEAQRGKVDSLIKKLTEYPQFHLLGQERINVLHLNLSLDKIK